MSLTLHFHPLASYCWKALIALYENDTPFTPNLVDLGNPAERAALVKLWGVGKFPVLRDDVRNETIPESSIVVEYLDQHYRGRTRFIPDDPARALQTRLRDRFYDLYVHLPMQKIMLDRLRPADKKDPQGVEEARARHKLDYPSYIDNGHLYWDALDNHYWPTVYLVDRGGRIHDLQIGEVHEGDGAAARLERLKARPSFARVLKEAEPYFQMVPKES